MPEAGLRPSPTLDVPRLDTSTSVAKEAYAALKRAITAMDIYDHAKRSGSTSGGCRRGSGSAAPRSARR